MKKLLILILFINIVVGCKLFIPKLIPISNIKGIHREGNFLVISKLHLKIDYKSTLYHNEQVCFISENNYRYSMFEMLENNNDYVIISPVKEEDIESSLIYMFPKDEIKIYSLNTGKMYDVKINFKKIFKIEEDKKRIIVIGADRKREVLDLKEN